MYPFNNVKLMYTTDFHKLDYTHSIGIGFTRNISETYLYIDMYKYRLIIGKIYKLRGGQ